MGVDGLFWVAAPPGLNRRACGGASIATGALRRWRTRPWPLGKPANKRRRRQQQRSIPGSSISQSATASVKRNVAIREHGISSSVRRLAGRGLRCNDNTWARPLRLPSQTVETPNGFLAENQVRADSPLEGNGFELPVPRAMQGRAKPIIAGFGCMPPSLDDLRLQSADISERGPKRNLGTKPYRAEPEVRIHLPPALSLLRTRSCRGRPQSPGPRGEGEREGNIAAVVGGICIARSIALAPWST